MIFSLSEKFSFGVASFDDGFAEFFELLPPRAKLSLGGDSLEVDSFGDKGFGVDSVNVDRVGACNLLLTGAGCSLLVADWPKPELFSFRGFSTGEDGVFEEDIIAPIAVII